jgi:hypothetical protein
MGIIVISSRVVPRLLLEVLLLKTPGLDENVMPFFGTNVDTVYFEQRDME